jgi:hypothetical protein
MRQPPKASVRDLRQEREEALPERRDAVLRVAVEALAHAGHAERVDLHDLGLHVDPLQQRIERRRVEAAAGTACAPRAAARARRRASCRGVLEGARERLPRVVPALEREVDEPEIGAFARDPLGRDGHAAAAQVRAERLPCEHAGAAAGP